MKKITAVILIVVMMASLGACGKKTDNTNDTDNAGTNTVEDNGTSNTQDTSDTTDKAITADTSDTANNSDTVDVTLPAAFFEDMTEEEIKANAEEKGFINIEVNKDGSVTYTMTKAKQKEILTDLKEEIDESIEDLLKGENKVASFKSVNYNEDLSKIDVRVDSSQYSAWDSLYAVTFLMEGAYYQMISGVEADDIDLTVNFIDDSTNEILDTTTYKDWINSTVDNDNTENE